MTVDTTAEQSGTIISGSTRIPVRNLWLLMVYASTLFHRPDLQDSGVEQAPEMLPNLVARLLADAVEQRLHRPLSRGHQPREADLSRVRGRIDVLRTETQGLLYRGQVSCRFTEPSVDTPANRLVYTALITAAARTGERSLQRRCAALADRLVQSGVTGRPVSAAAIGTVELGRNEADDRTMVHAARLLLQMQIPDESGRGHRQTAPVRDPRALRVLYEKAVFGFYSATLPAPWQVRRGHHRWPVVDPSPGLAAVLPRMETDVILEHPQHRMIVETKFADALKPGRYGGPMLARDHIFQLYAYVQSQHDVDQRGATAEGVLLYPTVGIDIAESATIQGHRYRFQTVDLAAPAVQIHQTLSDLVDPMD